MSYIGNKSQVALYDSFTKEQAEDTFSPITRSRKNLLINGGFDICQRGPSLAYASGKPYSADRWKVDSRGGAITVSRQPFPLGQIDVPSNPKYFMRVDHTAASNDGFVNAEQAIEGVHTLAGKTAVLVFYTKADRAFEGKLDMYQNFGTGGAPSAQNDLIDVNTFNFTTSWQRFTTVVNVPSISGKVLGTDGNDALRFLIFSKATTAFTLDIAQVQLEEGDTATDFEQRPVGEELALCQRYYQEGYAITSKQGATVTACNPFSDFKVTMRETPTVTTTPEQGTVQTVFPNKNFVTFSMTSSSAGQASTNYTADAEL